MAIAVTVQPHITTVEPRFIELSRWASETAWNLSPVGTIPILANEDEWRRWADAVVALPALAGVGAPRAEGFASWQAWAEQVNQSIQLVRVRG